MSNNSCKQCTEAKLLIQQWLSKQGHDQCHYYPDIFGQLAKLFEIEPTIDLNLPPREEFRRGCHQFEDTLYDKEKNSRAS